MKKKAYSLRSVLGVAALAAAICGTDRAYAQSFVKSYPTTINSTYSSMSISDLIGFNVGTNAYTAMLMSVSHLDIQNGATPNFILKKLDLNGNILFDVSYSVDTGWVAPSKVIHTNNDEYIVVGYYHRDIADPINYPFAARLGSNGNLMWSKYYPATMPVTGPWYSRLAQAVICPVIDDQQESYIIAANMPSAFNPGVNAFNTDINAIRIDAAGNPIWNYLYESVGTTYPNWDVQVADIVPGTALDFSGTKYLLAGVVDITGTTYSTNLATYMAIDKNGNVTNTLQNVRFPSYTGGVTAMYDRSIGNFVLAYTLSDRGPMGSTLPITYSEIGVTKLDYTSLSDAGTNEYWIQDARENNSWYGSSICEDQSGTAYMVAGFTSGGAAFPATAQNNVVTLYHMDKGGGPNYAHRYNEGTSSSGQAVVSTMDNSGAPQENHVMLVGAKNNARVVSADVNDEACGWVSYPLQAAPYTPPLAQPVNTIRHTVSGVVDLGFTADEVFCIPNPCQAGWDPENFRLAQEPAGNDMKVYPTLLQEGNDNIHIELNSDHAAQLMLALYNMEGRKIAEHTLNTQAGSNQLDWTPGAMVPGQYTLSVISSGGAIHNTTRITRL